MTPPPPRPAILDRRSAAAGAAAPVVKDEGRRGPNRYLLLGFGVVIVGALVWKRRYVLQAFDYAKSNIFLVLIPDAAKPYGDLILQESAAAGITPSLTVILGMRESGWGTTLTPPGPAGLGDEGHGHGLLQIDDRSNGPWLAANDWKDPRTNIRKGLQILKGKIAFLGGSAAVPGLTDGKTVTIGEAQAARRGIRPGSYPDPRPLTGDALVQAAVAAYNTGEGSVLRSVAAGLSPDATTAGSRTSGGRGDYSNWVLARVAALDQRIAQV